MAEEKFSFDQFDQMAQNRASVGAHRVQKKSHKWLIALVLVVLISPLVGVGIGTAMSVMRTGVTQTAQTSAQKDSGSASKESTPASNGASTAQKSAGTADTGKDGGASATAADSQPNLGAKVSVLNGTDEDGLAASNADKLKAAGFTAIKTDDYSDGDPEQSTIFYHGSDLRVTAQKIAAELGITTLTEDAAKAPGATDIVVVLRG
ncbi:MAG: LytR C-terminal domain-containing protein [Arcanobacterium sp.]|nr:LytR C-terminal domain-containing protein [Arcanobacterium sp.]